RETDHPAAADERAHDEDEIRRDHSTGQAAALASLATCGILVYAPLMPAEQPTVSQELRDALDQLSATAQILRVISESPGTVQPVLDTIAHSANRLCDGVFSALFQLEGEGIALIAQDGIGPEQLEAIRRALLLRKSGETMTGRAILERHVIHIPDVTQDAGYALMPLAREVGYRSFLSVPMSRGDRPIGAISVARREAHPFSERQIRLLETFADTAV